MRRALPMNISPDTRPRPAPRNSELACLETPLAWLRHFQTGWLAHYERTGELDWARYIPVKNELAPNGTGLRLGRARILLISFAGSFLRNKQAPFESANPLGDYSLRLLPLETAPSALAASDPEDVQALELLPQLAAAGHFMECVPLAVSCYGHQPHALRTVKECAPAVVAAACQARARGALLLANGPLAVQAAGLTARALELNGIATALVGREPGFGQQVFAPRLVVRNAGTTLAEALPAALAHLELNAPQPTLTL